MPPTRADDCGVALQRAVLARGTRQLTSIFFVCSRVGDTRLLFVGVVLSFKLSPSDCSLSHGFVDSSERSTTSSHCRFRVGDRVNFSPMPFYRCCLSRRRFPGELGVLGGAAGITRFTLSHADNVRRAGSILQREWLFFIAVRLLSLCIRVRAQICPFAFGTIMLASSCHHVAAVWRYSEDASRASALLRSSIDIRRCCRNMVVLLGFQLRPLRATYSRHVGST